MDIKFNSHGESFVAMTLLITHADGKASEKELNFILKNFSSQPLKFLDTIDQGDKFYFFLEIQNKIYKTFKKNSQTGGLIAFSDTETEMIIEAAKKVLKSELRETAFLLAVELAYVDGVTDKEKLVLEQIRTCFEINKKVASMIYDVVPIKYQKPDTLQNNNPTNHPIEFRSVADALIAIELALIFSDEDVSLKQRSHMFWNLTLLNIFKDKSPEYFYDTKYKILNMFNKHLDKPKAFTDKEIDKLILACKRIMGPKVRETALWVALELAYTTGLNEHEQKFINHLIRGMHIDRDVAKKISKVMPIKFRI